MEILLFRDFAVDVWIFTLTSEKATKIKNKSLEDFKF